MSPAFSRIVWATSSKTSTCMGFILSGHDLVQGEDGSISARVLEVVAKAPERAVSTEILHTVIGHVVELVVRVRPG